MTDVFQALAHPIRRKVLSVLRAGPRSAGELANAFPVSKPTMSRHFAILKDAQLIEAERVGTTVRYRLNMSVAEEAIGLVMDVLKTTPASEGLRREPHGKKETPS